MKLVQTLTPNDIVFFTNNVKRRVPKLHRDLEDATYEEAMKIINSAYNREIISKLERKALEQWVSTKPW